MSHAAEVLRYATMPIAIIELRESGARQPPEMRRLDAAIFAISAHAACSAIS